MRITLMGELADGTFELIWADGDLRGTPRLVERFRPAAESAGDDVLAFIRDVELGLGTRPQLIVWPDHDLIPDDDLIANPERPGPEPHRRGVRAAPASDRSARREGTSHGSPADQSRSGHARR